MTKETITYADFQKFDLRIGTILSAEKMENSDKLIKIEVDLGNEKRQLLAGLAQHFTASELIGQQIVVIVNLEYRKMMGMESQGMLLATEADGKVLLIQPQTPVPAGSAVR